MRYFLLKNYKSFCSTQLSKKNNIINEMKWKIACFQKHKIIMKVI